MKVKEESGKVGLKLNIQKMKIMAFGPITSWKIDGETMEIMRDLIFGGLKITADGDCSHGNCKEIQPIHPKGDRSWVFIERTDIEAETPIIWPLYMKN